MTYLLPHHVGVLLHHLPERVEAAGTAQLVQCAENAEAVAANADGPVQAVEDLADERIDFSRHNHCQRGAKAPRPAQHLAKLVGKLVIIRRVLPRSPVEPLH